MFKLSYPSLINLNVHDDSMLRGTTGNIISFLSNNKRGKSPSPLSIISTYGDVDEISGSSTYKDAIFSKYWGEKGLKLAFIMDVDPGCTIPSLGEI
jgi:hypothetical protein